MTAEERIVEIALAAVASGVDDYLELVDHCLKNSELAKEVDIVGDDPTEYLIFLLENTDRVRITDEGRVIRLDLLLDGVVFTHRITESEIAGDHVEYTRDLGAIDSGTRELEVPGGTVTLEFDWGDDPHLSEHGSLVGPTGWLDGLIPGDMAAFRRQGARLVVEPVSDLADGSREIEAIEHAFDAETDRRKDLGAEPGYVLEQALIAHPDLFQRPVPPTSELFAAVGLEISGAWMGRIGGKWKPPMVARLDDLRARLHSTYQFSDCCEEALDVVIAARSAHLTGEDVEARTVNRALGHGAVIEAFCEWVDALVGVGTPSIGDLATALAASGHRDIAPALMLRARHYEAAGDAPAAQLDLEAAVRIDPDFLPALVELAWYTSDRGDAPRTVSLLRRAGIIEDNTMLAYHAGLATDLPAVGRNQPCPCGSGRKYKVCHLGKSQIPVGERVNWLMSKLTTFVTRRDRIAALYGLASSAMLPDFEPEDLSRMVDDEFILELRVFEGGGVSEFLDARGMLVPEDEFDVLELWEMARLRLWEVTATDGDAGLTVRDTKTGETLDVSDRSMARTFSPGEQILARFLPGWGRTWASAIALRIDLRHRDSLLELLDLDLDADLIARWYGSLFAPPSFANREGEPLALCEARLRPADGWEALTRFLDGAYTASKSEPGVWQELLEMGPDEQVIRAVLRREGDELLIDANSEARFERVLSRLAGATEVVAQTVQPMRSPAEMEAFKDELPPGDPSVPPEPLDPNITDQIVDMMERRWLDEEVTALGGITPRQAAVDPTRREDLIALLRSFDRMDVGGSISMRPDVLRTHLGLET
ncbi:MAG: SEC-C metal-binding domain-containing protein [Actinomycetota bacterium]|nr:SEC-C metal-binding domain-containing protein [Actinomycetota bacterium]